MISTYLELSFPEKLWANLERALVVTSVAGQGMWLLKPARFYFELLATLRTQTRYPLQCEAFTPSLTSKKETCDQGPYSPGSVRGH